MAERLAARSLPRHPASLAAAAAWADTAPAALGELRPRPIASPTPPPRRAFAAPTPPRDYTVGAASGVALGAGAGTGLGAERGATLSARRTFVALKLTFLDATATLPGAESEWLREQVRTAEEPIDLWLLRAPLFAALAGTDPERRRLRRRLRRAIEAMFGEPQPTTAFAVLR